jgi:hypothetical protein
MQQHFERFFPVLVLIFFLGDCFRFSFLDKVHLIRSRDHHHHHHNTDIGSSRTGSLLLLTAPVPPRRSRPPLFISV